MFSTAELKRYAESGRARADLDVRLVAEGGFFRGRQWKPGLATFMELAWHVVCPTDKYDDNGASEGRGHIFAICQALEDVIAGKTRNLVINIPPGCCKSLLVEVFFPTYEWILDPGKSYISVSFDTAITLRDCKKARDLVQSEWFQARWPSVNIASGSPAGQYETSAGGYRFATSIGGKLTGRHASRVIIDDPHKPMDVSKTTLENVAQWLSGTLPTRFKTPTEASIILIMQRLHSEDASAILESKGFRVLRLPMRYEPQFHSTGDWRTEDGELLWPARFTAERLEVLEKTELGAMNTAAQHAQRPVPDGGSIFKGAWFKTWVPKGGTPPTAEGWTTLPDRFDRVVQSWDCAFKDSEDSDYVCGQVWGVKGPDFFLLDMFHDRVNVLGTAAAIEAMTKEWPRATAVLIEDKANGSAVMQILAKKVRGMVPIEPEGGKIARANAVSVFFESGNVYHPDASTAEWLQKHRAELTIFPMGKHDDTVDACTQALTWLHSNRSNLAAAMQALQKNPGGWPWSQ